MPGRGSTDWRAPLEGERTTQHNCARRTSWRPPCRRSALGAQGAACGPSPASRARGGLSALDTMADDVPVQNPHARTRGPVDRRRGKCKRSRPDRHGIARARGTSLTSARQRHPSRPASKPCPGTRGSRPRGPARRAAIALNACALGQRHLAAVVDEGWASMPIALGSLRTDDGAMSLSASDSHKRGTICSRAWAGTSAGP
jgi:hypothetical protein